MLSVTMAGLNAAQKSMDVTSNNMSNANTVGFKRSTAIFGDVFSSDPASNPKTAVGSGVMTSSVSRDTTAGAIKTTGRVTDLAIDGRGYFVVQDPSPGAPMTFTRAGNFGLDANGFIADSSGNQLMGFQAVQSFNSDGSPALDAARAVDLARTWRIEIVLAAAVLQVEHHLGLQRSEAGAALDRWARAHHPGQLDRLYLRIAEPEDPIGPAEWPATFVALPSARARRVLLRSILAPAPGTNARFLDRVRSLMVRSVRSVRSIRRHRPH